MPGAFAWPYLVIVVDPAYHPTLVYPARGAARLWSDSPAPPDPLARTGHQVHYRRTEVGQAVIDASVG